MISKSRNFTIFTLNKLDIPTVHYEEYFEYSQLEEAKRRSIGVRVVGQSALKESKTFDDIQEQYEYAENLKYSHGSKSKIYIIEEETYLAIGTASIMDPSNPRVTIEDGFEEERREVVTWCNKLSEASTMESVIKFTFGVKEDRSLVMISI